VARSVALDLLAAAPKTRAQLAEAMRKRGVPDEAAEAVLDRFDEVGLIDDAAFATAWVRSRHSVRGLAPRVLAGELRQRGVAEPLIADAVSELDQGDVESAARALVARRAHVGRGLPTAVRVRRLVGMLQRKGYPGDVAFRVVREVLADETLDPDAMSDDTFTEVGL
jgi:regulatory protein